MKVLSEEEASECSYIEALYRSHETLRAQVAVLERGLEVYAKWETTELFGLRYDIIANEDKGMIARKALESARKLAKDE